jgi:hypothetical protein
VRMSICVAIQNLLTGEEPTPTAAVTTGTIPFNAAGLIGILAEPTPVLAVPPRSFGPLTACVTIDTPEEVDPAAPVAAGTNTGAAVGKHTGTSSRAASVRCLFLFCGGCSHADHCLSQAPLDASEAADTALPVAAGTHTGTSSCAASVRCLFLFCRGGSHAYRWVSQAAHSPGPTDTSVGDDCSDLSDMPAEEK